MWTEYKTAEGGISRYKVVATDGWEAQGINPYNYVAEVTTGHF